MKLRAIIEGKIILTCCDAKMYMRERKKEKRSELGWIKVKIMPALGEQFISLSSSPKSTS